MSWAVRIELVHLKNDEDPFQYLGDVVETNAFAFADDANGLGIEHATDLFGTLSRKLQARIE